MADEADVVNRAGRAGTLWAARGAALAATFVGLLALLITAPLNAEWPADTAAVAIVFIASLATAIFAQAHPVPAGRRAWTVLGMGMLIYAVGLMWMLDAGQHVELLEPANLLRLALYPAVAVALIVLFRRRDDRESGLSITLDAAIFTLAIGALVVEGIFNGLAPIGDVVAANTQMLAFPLLDLGVLMGLTLIAAPSMGRLGGAYLLLQVGFLLLAVADISYAVGPPGAAAQAPTISLLAWPAAFLFLAPATGFGISMREIKPLRGTWLYVLGIGSVAICLVILLSDALGDRDPLVITLATAGLCLAIARFLTLARENGRLARDTDSIINAAGEGIYRIDREGRVTYINASALEILGFDEAEVLGENSHRLIHHTRANGSPYPASECAVCRTLTEGATHRVTGEVYWRADGSSFPVDYTSAPIRRRGETVGAVVVFDDVTHQRQLEERLEGITTHDHLTGLPNRLRLEEELAGQLRYVEQYRHPGAVLAIDLDAFKLVNESAGHSAGDEVLCEVAALLTERVDQTDVAARITGDEFALLLREASEEKAATLGRELITEIRKRTALPLSASVGVAPFDGAHERSVEELLVCAEVAIAEAKRRGGGTVVVADSRLPVLQSSVEWLREALREGPERFRVYAQPIASARSGEVVREELLVRMLDAEGEEIPPGKFLPTAERYGLVPEIDLLVLERGIELAREGRRLAINLSGRSLTDERILARVRAAIADGIDPGSLSFEITETAAVANMADARRFALAVRELGCGLALDDFGTGFSSFAYLKNIPAQVLKIDMDFIRELPRNPADRYLVKAMVGIARGLGQSTVAEGVEDATTLAIVRELGVDNVQGFHIGQPAPVDSELVGAGFAVPFERQAKQPVA